MKRATWCGCGCGERVHRPLLPPKAARLMTRRRRAEIAAAQAAAVAQYQRSLQQAMQLATAPAGGTA